jgi:hypothetical protein
MALAMLLAAAAVLQPSGLLLSDLLHCWWSCHPAAGR